MIMRKTALIFILIFISCAALEAQENTIPQIHHDSLYMSTSELADKIIEEAYRHLGIRYKYGANGPRSFDCTGFTCYVYNKFGYKLSRSSKDQSTDGKPVEGSFRNLQKGDILIFGSRRNKREVGHAGIFIELVDSTATDFRFIHASTKKGITISNYSETYYRERFLGARRILPDIIPGGPARGSESVGEAQDTIYVEASAADRQVVLLESGRWFYIDADGRMTKPDSSVTIILDGNGKWRTVSNEGTRIPQMTRENRPSVSAQPADLPREETAAKYHIVRNGDTLYGIAKKYKTTIDKLCRLNGITKKTVLKTGRKLRVK